MSFTLQTFIFLFFYFLTVRAGDSPPIVEFKIIAVASCLFTVQSATALYHSFNAWKASSFMEAITVSLRKNAKDNKKRKTVKASKYIQLLVQMTEMITIGRYFFSCNHQIVFSETNCLIGTYFEMENVSI